MADNLSAPVEVRSHYAFAYVLDAPAHKSATQGGGEARYACCHVAAAAGHALTCQPEDRIPKIEAALTRAGITFRRIDELPGAAPSETRSGDEPELSTARMSESGVRIVGFQHVADEDMRITPEQEARDLLEECGVPDAQSYTSGRLGALANLIAAHRTAKDAARTAQDAARFSLKDEVPPQQRSSRWDESAQLEMAGHCGRIAGSLAKGHPVTLVAHGRTLGTFLPAPLNPLGFDFAPWPRPIRETHGGA